MDLLIKNGWVVTKEAAFYGDVGVKNGKIVYIGTEGVVTAKQVVDADGLWVLPGAIDVHTHLAMPFGGTVSADGYLSGTRAAACGGVTTVFDYPMQRGSNTIMSVIEEKQAICETEACVDYAFHCIITDLNEGKTLEEMAVAVAAGITSFKCFFVYKKEGLMVSDGTFVRLMLRAKEIGAMINLHAENPDVIDYFVEQFKAEGKLSPWYHYESRPEFVEAEADIRAVHLAKAFEGPLYIVHMANKEGLLAAIDAKRQGYPIYIETCPQYLAFTNDVYKGENAHHYVCSPPIKGQESQDALWAAIANNDVDVVATDHCPFQSYEKDWGLEDFTKIPNGCAGVENMYPYMLSQAQKGKLTVNQAVALCATNPAKLFGCDQKGAIEIGKDADLVLYDPKKTMTISVGQMHSDYDHTIWEGHEITGYPVQTYLRGQLVYDQGDFVGQPGMGRFVKRIPRQ